MKQTLRLLQMLRDLPRGHGRPKSTASALAERYDASERSIYRDVNLLREAGYAVANDNNGYYLLPTDQAVPVALTSAEIASLIYATHWVEDSVPEGLRPDFRAVVDKLVAACGTDEAVMAALDTKDGIDISATQNDGPSAVGNMALAITARRKGRQLRGIYHTPDRDEVNERVLHPYAVTFRGNAHYLVAFCEMREEERTFRLDRFEYLEILPQWAEIPEDYDIDEHFSGAWEVTSGRRETVRIRVRGKTARRMRNSTIHESQQMVRMDDDTLEITFCVAITDELRSWILSLGPDATVLEPAILKEEIATMIDQMSANYPEE